MYTIYQCTCDHCQQFQPHPDKFRHQQINRVMSRLSEQQQRWYAAHEARKLGVGGEVLLAQITGLSPETIRLGCNELEDRDEETLIKQLHKVVNDSVPTKLSVGGSIDIGALNHPMRMRNGCNDCPIWPKFCKDSLRQ